MIRKIGLILAIIVFTLSMVTSAQQTPREDFKSFATAYKEYQKAGTQVTYATALEKFNVLLKQYGSIDKVIDKAITLANPGCFARCDSEYLTCLQNTCQGFPWTCEETCGMARLACYVGCMPQ